MHGWKNWETWCASLWLGNDEHLYNKMIAFLKNAKIIDYDAFLKATRVGRVRVDGMFLDDAAIDRGEMNEFLQSFKMS